MDTCAPPDELSRLGDLYALDLLDSTPDERFDRITRLTCHAMDTPIALVSLVDADRQWFCSRQGLDATETPRRDAFCAHTINHHDPIMIVEDARHDHRFANNPLVIGEPHIRFYAGAPISSPAGQRIGTLCIIDHHPRQLTTHDQHVLRDLADLVEREVHHVALALTDPLTGLPNRRAFAAAANRLVPLAQTRATPITMLYADLDGLKTVNDEHGHGQGDALLRRTGKLISTVITGSDIAARIGGDEFAVILYNTDDTAAHTVVDNIQHAITNHNLHMSNDVALSLSIGSATATATESVSELANRADHAMYATRRRHQHALTRT